MLLVVLLTLLTLVGRLTWWWAELASHFSWHYLLIGSPVALVLAGLGHPRWASLALGVAVANLWIVWPRYLAPAASCAHPLNILQVNVHGDSLPAEDFGRWLDGLGQKPDVLALLEVPPSWALWLKGKRKDYPVQAGALRLDPFGLWLLAGSGAMLRLENGPGDIPEVVADLAGGLSLSLAHPPPPLNATLAEARNAWLGRLGDGKGARIVLGDFNLTPWSPWNKVLFASGLCDAGAALPPGGTWPAALPSPLALPIDRTLISADLSVRGRRVLPASGLASDHRGVWTEICSPVGPQPSAAFR